MNRYRVSSRVYGHLTGSHLFQCPDELEAHGYGPEGVELVHQLADADANARGVRTVELDAASTQVLRELVETMALGAADNTWDPDGLADLNAARAMLRQLSAVAS